MLRKNKGAWQNVRIIGISLDKGIPELKARVDDKGWTSVEHYWKAGSSAD